MTDRVAGGAACFTRSGYRALLESGVDAGYQFVSFADPPAAEVAPYACLLRHDVDVDPWAARELARIESDCGVRSTYFLMLRSPFYNLFGRANHEMIEEIVELGHWIALHYDVAFAPLSGRSHEDEIAAQATAMAELLGAPVEAVSFHQPAHAANVEAIQPSDVVSAYDYPGFAYLSDANKAARVRDAADRFSRREFGRLQLVIHPVWWATDDPAATTHALFEDALLRNLVRAQEQIVETERAFGPARTFRIETVDV